MKKIIYQSFGFVLMQMLFIQPATCVVHASATNVSPSLNKASSASKSSTKAIKNIEILDQQQIKSTSTSFHWGVNIHDGGDSPEKEADRMVERNLKYARMDFEGDIPAKSTKFIQAVKIMNAHGIKCTAILFSDFAFGRPRTTDYGADLKAVELSVYNDLIKQVVSTKDLNLDYELHNEIPLYPNMKVAGSTGEKALDYDTPAGRLQAAALRGMSKAVNDVRKLNNLPIRIILGTVDRQFGFLTYMQQQGVIFDVVGYHIYPNENHAALDVDPWFGTGGPLGQLAKFNLPIQINELNSGEIYSGAPDHAGVNYENKEGQPMTESGYRSLYKHVNEIINCKVANVEGVSFYELFDETFKALPENRFGLYYDTEMTLPKISVVF